jgi:hypothetical protein
MRRPVTDLEAIQDRVVVSESGCWEWQLMRTPLGYGRWNWCGRNGWAHRMVYEMLVGTIPDGKELDHTCGNRGCVNPAHLEPVTHAENVRRAFAGRTHCRYGHEYTVENTYIGTHGYRQCRECRRGYARRVAPSPLDRTQCRRGHARTPENGHVDKTGRWVCRVCKRDAAREAKRAKGAKPWSVRRAETTHCPHGHEYTEQNTYWYVRDGSRYRYCRTCNREAARKRAA